MGRLGKRVGVSVCRRVGVCRPSSTPPRPPGHYSRVEKQSIAPELLTPELLRNRRFLKNHWTKDLPTISIVRSHDHEVLRDLCQTFA